LGRSNDRWVGGVAGGIADHLGIDPVVVRVAVVVLAVSTGIGVLVYVAAWWLLPVAGDPNPPRWAALAEHGGPVGRLLERLGTDDARTVAGIGCLAAGGLLLLRDLGLLFSPGVVVPASLAGAGLALVWSRASDDRREQLRSAASRLPGSTREVLIGGRVPVVRLVGGVVLVVAGLAAFLTATEAYATAGNALLAIGVTLVGAALLLGPWIYRLVRALGDERRRRIRSEERADIAAHLHDSVLQTLALIQRSAPSRPADAVALARRQERELRTWLYADGARAGANGGPTTVVGSVSLVAEEVEADHGVEVEVVAVGDHPLSADGATDRDRDLAALVAATREALVNAAKHAGVSMVDCYVEVEPRCVRVFVRDRGKGFDPAVVPADRRGLADSVTGRLERHGGRATVVSAPGEGTEVTLEVALP
jgi:signal transduction histidine kinase/phage shock protein PspC (stress-responsive transcriptional regulator)